MSRRASVASRPRSPLGAEANLRLRKRLGRRDLLMPDNAENDAREHNDCRRPHQRVVGMEQREPRQGSQRQHDSAISAAGFSEKRPNMANAMPQVPITTMIVSAICNQPGLMTMLERVKIANVISVMGRQILSASHIVRMNDASAIRADTAAVSEVGGDSSPQTESRNTKKCATHGLMPSLTSGGDDDDGADDVGRRRRQAGANQPAEDIGHQDHRNDVPGAEIEQHRTHPVDEAGDGEQADHDAERRQQQRQVGRHVGMGFDPRADVAEQRSPPATSGSFSTYLK